MVDDGCAHVSTPTDDLVWLHRNFRISVISLVKGYLKTEVTGLISNLHSTYTSTEIIFANEDRSFLLLTVDLRMSLSSAPLVRRCAWAVGDLCWVAFVVPVSLWVIGVRPVSWPWVIGVRPVSSTTEQGSTGIMRDEFYFTSMVAPATSCLSLMAAISIVRMIT